MNDDLVPVAHRARVETGFEGSFDDELQSVGPLLLDGDVGPINRIRRGSRIGAETCIESADSA